MGKRIVATLLLLMLVFTTVSTALAVEKVNVSGIRYVVSDNKKPVNIRKGPSTKKEFTAQGQVPYGAKVTLHQKTVSGKWYYVDYNGKYGWMQSSYLSTTKPKTLADKAKEEAERKANKVKEAIEKITKPFICGHNGCTAKATRTGEWYQTNKKMPDGSLKPMEMREVRVTCEKGHAFSEHEEREP